METRNPVLCRMDGQFGLVVVAKITGKTPERAGLTREKGAKLNLKAAFKNLQERVAMSLNKRSHDDHDFRYGACSTACCSSQEHLDAFTCITPVFNILPRQRFIISLK